MSTKLLHCEYCNSSGVHWGLNKHYLQRGHNFKNYEINLNHSAMCRVSDELPPQEQWYLGVPICGLCQLLRQGYRFTKALLLFNQLFIYLHNWIKYIEAWFLIWLYFCCIAGGVSDIQLSGYASTAFKCEKCGRVYRWPENLRRHIRQECGKEPKYVCNQCGYKAKYKSSMICLLYTSRCV